MNLKLFSVVTLAGMLLAGIAGARTKMATSGTIDLTGSASARTVTWGLDGYQTVATLTIAFDGTGNGTDIQTTCEGSTDGATYGKITVTSGSNIIAAVDDYDTAATVTIMTQWNVTNLVLFKCVFSSTSASAGDAVVVFGHSK